MMNILCKVSLNCIRFPVMNICLVRFQIQATTRGTSKIAQARDVLVVVEQKCILLITSCTALKVRLHNTGRRKAQFDD